METRSPFRAVTAEEVAHYEEHGWVKLECFIPLDWIADLLAMAKDKMGGNGDRNLPPESFSYFNPLTLRGLNDPVLRPVIDQCGRGARLLMNRRADVGIKYFTDNFAVKLPSKRKQDAKGGAGISDWHQDYAASGSDRSGGMVFWIAMEDFTPEKGTMAFLNGSHRHGVMGHYATYGAGNLLSAYPELPELYESSGNLSYAAGDVTVHHNLTVHSAGENVTDSPRWTYIVIVNPADACWTGGSIDASPKTDDLTLSRPFPEARFPVIA
jgi:hypothetical protein